MQTDNKQYNIHCSTSKSTFSNSLQDKHNLSNVENELVLLHPSIQTSTNISIVQNICFTLHTCSKQKPLFVTIDKIKQNSFFSNKTVIHISYIFRKLMYSKNTFGQVGFFIYSILTVILQNSLHSHILQTFPDEILTGAAVKKSKQ